MGLWIRKIEDEPWKVAVFILTLLLLSCERGPRFPWWGDTRDFFSVSFSGRGTMSGLGEAPEIEEQADELLF